MDDVQRGRSILKALEKASSAWVTFAPGVAFPIVTLDLYAYRALARSLGAPIESESFSVALPHGEARIVRGHDSSAPIGRAPSPPPQTALRSGWVEATHAVADHNRFAVRVDAVVGVRERDGSGVLLLEGAHGTIEVWTTETYDQLVSRVANAETRR